MDSRAILLEKLNEKKWYKSSSKKIRDEVDTNLKDGLLKTLSSVNDFSDFGEVLSLYKINTSGDVVHLGFEVRFSKNNETKIIEALALQEGNNPLSKGLVLVETSGKVSHLLLERKLGLSTFKTEHQTFSMIYPDFTDGKIVKLPSRIAKSIPSHVVKKYYDLGYVWPDSNLIMAKTFVFALTVSVDDINLIDQDKVHLVSLENSDELLDINDGYFFTIYSRLKIKGII